MNAEWIVNWRTLLVTLSVIALGFTSIITGRPMDGNTMTVLITVVPLYFAQSVGKKAIEKRRGT